MTPREELAALRRLRELEAKAKGEQAGAVSAPPPQSVEPDEAPNPTAGMSPLALNLAGLGSSIARTGRGLKQVGTSAAEFFVRSNPQLFDQRSIGSVVTGEDDSTAGKLRASLVRQQAEEADFRKLDAPLNATAAGLTGNIVGTVGQLLGPGLALRGTSAAAAFLPRTIAGNASQGAAFGAAQPTVNEGERAGNIGIGAALPAAAMSALRAGGAGLSALSRLSPAVTQGQQSRAAADVLNQFAADPAALRAGATSPQTLVPGSVPTLAEASGDVGLAGLQRTLANVPEFGNALFQRGTQNNRARVSAVEGAFGGADDAAATAVRTTRDQAARRTLRPIERVPLRSIEPVAKGVDRIADRFQANHAVRDAMQAVREELPRIRTVGDAHSVRQFIGQLIGGQVEGKAGAKLAKRELMAVQTLLDREMRSAFPEWGTFLREFKGASRQADQIDVGAELLATGRAVRGATNEPVLSPAQFSRAAENLDRTVQRATGFRRATAARTLTPEQQQTVDAVRRDLERFSRAQTDGKAVGSNTVQNAIGGNSFQSAVGPVGAAMIEPVSGIAVLGLNQMRAKFGAKVADLVQEAMLDPARAAEILASVPTGQRAEVVRAAARLIPRAGGTAGVVAPALTE